MKPLNSAERKKYRLKFIGLYIISIVLIIVVLSAFLQPAPAVKVVVVEKEKPAVVNDKPAVKKSFIQINFHERDSLISIISFNEKKIDSLNALAQIQKDTIATLQNLTAKTNKPVNNTADKSEIAKLNKQIEFYDWALRSQIAVTNTLTKENNTLKNKVAELSKAK